MIYIAVRRGIIEVIDFGTAERRILGLLSVGSVFSFLEDKYTVVVSGKPTCSAGEPKTDIYVKGRNNNGLCIELKISYKKDNADFLENKTSAFRAEQIFGSQWKDIIMKSTISIKGQFENRAVVFKKRQGKTESGAITLGWKFEIMNKSSGNLSGLIVLSDEQRIDIYSGTSLGDEKRNALVMGNRIENSGIANYMLTTVMVNSTQDVIDNLVDIENFAKSEPPLYFACKALNYRTFKEKYDGDRPLAVFVDWSVNNGILTHNLIFDKPLVTRGNEVARNLKLAMEQASIKTTNDITAKNIDDFSIVYDYSLSYT